MFHLTRFISVVGFGLVLAIAVAHAHGQLITLVENFEDNEPWNPYGGWTFNTASYDQELRQRGANHYFFAYVDNYGISLSTHPDWENPWVGDKDYRASGVVSLAFTTAVIPHREEVTRPMSVLLHNDNGTPDDIYDDYGFYHVLDEEFVFDGTIRTFRYPIPSQVSGETPEGWFPYVWGAGSPEEFTWDEVITDVDRILFDYFHPEYYYIYEPFDVGADNIKITIDRGHRGPESPGGDDKIDEGLIVIPSESVGRVDRTP